MGLLSIFLGVSFSSNMAPVDKNSKDEIIVEIPIGSSTKDIAKILEEKELIKNKDFFYYYARINKINNLKASTYKLNKTMSLTEIINVLSQGNNYNPDMIVITFQEGINFRKIASIIEKNTNNTKEDVYNLVSDKTYLDELIDKYWFITNDIKNNNIYYPLEGYLYPETYFLDNKDVSVKEIFEIMLNEMGKKLEPLKEAIQKKGISVHEFLTLASIIELEGYRIEDKANIASVFYNRINKKMSLGSDVTTYYAFKVDMNERDLLISEINTYNPYNTRGPKMEGKIPIGPVSIPSYDSINAAVNPTDTKYLYFVADKNRKVYFTKTYNEHLQKIKELKNKGVWFEW